ncbi:MAG: DnaD domain protein [Lachnospiraceae bacterium]|nr:DnaD domain protein [Lachnospiraceae bacterium]
MDTILRCSGYLPATTYIHNTFIENYMLTANGSYVKVYIYLSKCIQTGENNLSISSLADKMDNTEKDILRALHYWEKNNLIHLIKNGNNDEITGIEILNPDHMDNSPNTRTANRHSRKTGKHETPEAYTKPDATTDSPAEKSSTAEPGTAAPGKTDTNSTLAQDKTNTSTTRENPNSNTAGGVPAVDNPAPEKQERHIDIKITAAQTKRLASDEEFIWTSRVIESYVNRPLNPGEIQLVSYLYDNLGFSPDLLLYLYEYCISLGKTNVNYIQAVALSWDEQNIKSPEDAKNASSNYKSTYTAISKAFALGRPLAIVEKQYASRWLDEWHMDLAVVLDACSRTMLKLQKADFKYTEGILDNWHKNNIHTLQDVGKADEIYAQKKTGTQSKKQHDSTQGNRQDKNQFNKFQQRETSQAEVDELEKKLLAH